jgi:hypothetical protein
MLAIVIALLAGFYYYKKHVIDPEDQSVHNSTASNEPFHILENSDTLRYLESIELGKPMSIMDVSLTFYKNKIFWPYIYRENKNIDNPLNMPKGTILNIPKVKESLLEFTEANVEHVGFIGDSILNAEAEKRKPNKDLDYY